ncbi:MAG: DUF2283 domain-containing protein [Myxacorys chilensis ATA2-1-KO14]|jgi:uncharacterized protein YuzE|nr:DUF2283 domain-containing protein [Myxacorys chilensis ATA2-1-KO14]
MRITHDKEANAAYLYLKTSSIVDSEEIAPGIVYDYDEKDEVVGIEILNLRQSTPERIQRVNFPFSPQDRTALREFFSLCRNKL